MPLSPVVDLLCADASVAPVLAAAREGVPAVDVSAAAGAHPALVAALARHDQGPVLAVTATGREADDLVASLGELLPGGPDVVAGFPSWETLPHERLSPGRTPWDGGWPRCVGWPTRTTPTRRPAR